MTTSLVLRGWLWRALLTVGLIAPLGCGAPQTRPEASGDDLVRYRSVDDGPGSERDRRARAEQAARDGLATQLRVRVETELSRTTVREIVRADDSLSEGVQDLMRRSSRQTTDLLLEGLRVETRCGETSCECIAELDRRAHARLVLARQAERERALDEAIQRAEAHLAAGDYANALRAIGELPGLAGDARELWLWRLAFEADAPPPRLSVGEVARVRSALLHRAAFAPAVRLPGDPEWDGFHGRVAGLLASRGCNDAMGTETVAPLRLEGEVTCVDEGPAEGDIYVHVVASLRLVHGTTQINVVSAEARGGGVSREQALRAAAQQLEERLANRIADRYHCPP